MKKSILFLIFMSFTTHFLWSQTKNEQEERVSLNAFPSKAITVINTLPNTCKRLRFYKEIDGSKESFEVKFKYKKQRYSIEFSTDGTIEDIEVITKLKHIDDTVKTTIKNYYKTSFLKHKFIKLQEQYVYNTTMKATNFVSGVLAKTTTISNYEIIAEVKSESKRNIREFTFNANGDFVNSRLLNPSSYEHVLY